ncbi:hypothetical protein [Moorena sp. SIO3B2]|uniref:hypothetical protein n=1 Tax=Moorena sp. SIO3B2 TaxID=2607827 RepID=UPI0013C655FB|nr:hypothetical protein [Moorena sp. SIO3B2]NEP35783.1 hypothetical protein [Moorena sp. SIO3B2]
MKEKINIKNLETRPSQETDLLKLSVDDLKGVVGGGGNTQVLELFLGQYQCNRCVSDEGTSDKGN